MSDTATSQRRLCAHANEDGAGMHWLDPGEVCDRLPKSGDVRPMAFDRMDRLNHTRPETDDIRVTGVCEGAPS